MTRPIEPGLTAEQYGEHEDHPLYGVPQTVLDAGRTATEAAVPCNDIEPTQAHPIADAVIAAALPQIRQWLVGGDKRSSDVVIPADGSRWVWEIDKPYARALIEVVGTRWNGEAWWVRTRTLLDAKNPHYSFPDCANELGRFREAVTPVGEFGWVTAPATGHRFKNDGGGCCMTCEGTLDECEGTK